MFGLEWSRGGVNEKELYNIVHNDDIIKNIIAVSPLMWGEHCLECAVPECYSTCPKYEPRDDKRCKRFKNGVEKIKTHHGVWGYSVKVSFSEWGKLEAVFNPHVIKYTSAKCLGKMFDFTTSLSKCLPSFYPRRLNYLYKEYITRKLGSKKGERPTLFLAEILNPGKQYKLILEVKTDEHTTFRKALQVMHGFNRFLVPFTDLKTEEGVRNYISIYPENDLEVDVYFDALDLIVLAKPVAECIELPKIKCVVWDLDNTVWNGILSEGDNVAIREEVVKTIKELDRRGILNSVASKNNYDDAINKLHEFGIEEYFLCPQINWNMKSTNIQHIANLLDIGIDTFAFVDDMSYERNEVSYSLPFVRTFDASDIQSLMSCPDVDVPITEACAMRRQSYREIANRNADLVRYEGNLAGFVKNCNIVVTVERPKEESFMRCHELIQRTNQLNLSGERISFEGMKELFERKDIMAHTISVKDKYGNYGLVGVAIYRVQPNSLELIHFVLSCRAARKLIEQSYFEYIIAYFRDNGIANFIIRCAITEKNVLLRKSVEEICTDNRMIIDETHYTLSVNCSSYIPKYEKLMTIRYDEK